MLPSMFRTRAVSIVVASLLVHFAYAAPARGADAAPATQPAADASVDPAAALQPLTPCLAVHADGSPLGTLKSFPSTKQITVVFRLKPEESAKQLSSRWIAQSVDGAAAQTPIAENSMDLQGLKAGWLRLTLKQPAPPGKYQLVALLDEKPWQSVDIEIVPPIDGVNAEKAADLIPLKPNATMSYDMLVRPSKTTKSEIPGVAPGPDGSSRATLAMTYGAPDDIGMPVKVGINGKALGEMWVKHGDDGLRAVKMKERDKIVDASHVIYPMPPKLEDGVEWTATTKEGGEQKLQLFGPVPIGSGEGTVPGFIIFSTEELTIGEPGVPASRGRETVARSFIPGVGMVREERVSVLGGQYMGRNSLTLKTGDGGGGDGKAYTLVADPTMKGRLGRVRFAFPKDSKASNSAVAVYKGDERVAGGYGDNDFELMPGQYLAEVSKKRVPVEVK